MRSPGAVVTSGKRREKRIRVCLGLYACVCVCGRVAHEWRGDGGEGKGSRKNFSGMLITTMRMLLRTMYLMKRI